jgi:hypothetical protein
MLAVGVAAFGACGGETDTIYGPPGGLRNAVLPSPTGTTTGTGTTPTPDSGTPMTDGSTGGDVGTMACTVSFKTQIYPKMQDAGPWKCSDAQCHGGAQPPAISATDATAAYNSLVAYVTNGKPYIKTGSTVVADSNFDCNIRGTCLAGAMPVPGGAVGAIAATTAEYTLVETWIACGSPNN